MYMSDLPTSVSVLHFHDYAGRYAGSVASCELTHRHQCFAPLNHSSSLLGHISISPASNENLEFKLKDRVFQKLASSCDMSSFSICRFFLNHCFTHHLFICFWTRGLAIVTLSTLSMHMAFYFIFYFFLPASASIVLGLKA